MRNILEFYFTNPKNFDKKRNHYDGKIRLYSIRLGFVPQDVWVGIFWTSYKPNWPIEGRRITIYICFIPFFPIVIFLSREKLYYEHR